MSPQLELGLPAAGKAPSPAAPAAAIVRRRCEWCERPLKKKARKNALTCSKACRQAKSRATRAEVSCDATSLRRKDAPIMSRVAVERSGVASVASELLSAERVQPPLVPPLRSRKRLKEVRAD